MTAVKTPAGRSRARTRPQPEQATEPAPPQVTERVVVREVPAEPEVQRTCCYCSTRRPLSQLVPFTTSMVCKDSAGCTRRAREKHLLPETETETALALVHAAQGAMSRRDDSEASQLRNELDATTRAIREQNALVIM